MTLICPYDWTSNGARKGGTASTSAPESLLVEIFGEN
jgi:hypothetical protein